MAELLALVDDQMPDNPHFLFANWFEAAQREPAAEPTAMTLATVSDEGRPASRIVLLKGHDKRGFVFYTNFESRKGRELAERPVAALTFWWPWIERQIRVEGRVQKVKESEADAYFASRPRASQLGAWASSQSRTVSGRAELDREMQAVEERFRDREVPRPPFWGGYRLHPDRIEFWQHQDQRLHDRIRYCLEGTDWVRERLAP